METPTKNYCCDGEEGEDETKLQELLSQLKELSPDTAEKLINKVSISLKEDAYGDLVKRLSKNAEASVTITLTATKKKLEEMLKAKRRMGEQLDEDAAAELIYEKEEIAVLGAVDEFLYHYKEDLLNNASQMSSKRQEKKREREQAALEKKKERRSQNKAAKTAEDAQ